MCVVSYIGDYATREIPKIYPWVIPTVIPTTVPPVVIEGPSKEEFDALKKEVEALKKLLKAAKKYDKETGQPGCQTDEKFDLLKKIAEKVGVDLKDVI
jgi:hypothetical protein